MRRKDRSRVLDSKTVSISQFLEEYMKKLSLIIQTIFRRPGSEPESKPVYIQWKDGYEERTRETCKRCDLPLFYFNQKGMNPKSSIAIDFSDISV